MRENARKVVAAVSEDVGFQFETASTALDDSPVSAFWLCKVGVKMGPRRSPLLNVGRKGNREPRTQISPTGSVIRRPWAKSMLRPKRSTNAAALLPLFVGCWSNYKNTVTATVTFEDGAPVPSGTVSFSTDSFETFGKIENGYVSIGNMDGGVPDGTYKIAVRAYVEKSDANRTLESIVARKFEDPETSGILVEVEGNKSIEIVVGRP